ncbi:hypothetical protein Vafri_9804 [Volvox africanus]|uniref:NYN domain-containing protein n=1 Tax=Volvox africanus TaxID=51714 RepID=A0A8J4F056_9CHLO|nr:hypothetical protein Vafri_9804 [Volvox africanus]
MGHRERSVSEGQRTIRSPADAVQGVRSANRYIKQHFIYELGRMEYRTVAAVTPKSLNIIRKKYPNFVEQVVPELTLLVASAEEPKRNADVMLKKELYRFVSEHAHIARHSPGQLTVVLLSGDEDFLEPVQVALNSGFAVELMHHEQPSWALLSQQGYARPPLLWADFLKERSGTTQEDAVKQQGTDGDGAGYGSNDGYGCGAW